MFKRNKQPVGGPTRIDTLVGAGTRIIGDVHFTGGLHVDGHVKGNVDAPPTSTSTLSVSDAGVIEGSVAVPNVVLNGVVKGDILAHGRVELGATAKVSGNVYYGLIEMAMGAAINGKLIHEPRRMGNPAVSTAAQAAGGSPGLEFWRPWPQDHPTMSIEMQSPSDSAPVPLGIPAALLFTDAAASKVAELIREEANPALKLRVFVTGGGCSGFQYGFTFDEKVEEGDTCIENQGVQLLVDPMSVQYLMGAEIDYREDLEGAQFVIRNPNATTTCGCGSSFSM